MSTIGPDRTRVVVIVRQCEVREASATICVPGLIDFNKFSIRDCGELIADSGGVRTAREGIAHLWKTGHLFLTAP